MGFALLNKSNVKQVYEREHSIKSRKVFEREGRKQRKKERRKKTAHTNHITINLDTVNLRQALSLLIE